MKKTKRSEYHKDDPDGLRKLREIDRRYQALKRKNNPELKKKENALYYKNNKEKIKAHSQLHYQLKIKNIKKGVCAKCGDINVQGHHEDYSKPLEIVWLCPSHHKLRHIELKSINQ